MPALASAATEILVDQKSFRLAARARAKEILNVDTMVDKYLKILLED